MGDGRVRSKKAMLPESMMGNPTQLRRWIARAFEGAASLPAKKAKKAKKATVTKRVPKAAPAKGARRSR